MKSLLRSCIAVFALTIMGFAQEAPKLPATLKPAERLAEKWWKDRFEQKLALAEKGPYDIVFLGDSITHAWDNQGAAPLKKHFAEATILNLGFSGDRTEHVLWRIEKMPWETIKPKAFMIMIGTNNAGHSNRDSAEDIAAGIAEIVKQLREKAPEAKIMQLAIFPRADLPNHPMRVKNSIANALTGKLADNKNVFFWDIGSTFMKPDGTTLDRALMPDALHTTQAGYNLWAAAVAPTLLKWVGKEAPAAEAK